MLIAYLDAIGDQRVKSATLLNTLIDFSQPGVLGTFTDRETVERLEAKMARQGYLEGREMATTFDLLRANDLIWNYVASNWLMGEDPPAFDILAWNADSTRMPAAMHSFYLRTCYLDNQLARGEMELAGVRLHLDAVTQDLYLVGAVTDHITPWTSSYNTTQLVKGDTAFVLSSSGHIAGIVNPPSPKAATGPTTRTRPTPTCGWPGRPSTPAPGGTTGSPGPRPTAASAASPHPWATTSTPPSPTPRRVHPTRSSRGRPPGMKAGARAGPGLGPADLLDDLAGAAAGLAGGAFQLAVPPQAGRCCSPAPGVPGGPSPGAMSGSGRRRSSCVTSFASAVASRGSCRRLESPRCPGRRRCTW